MTIQIHVPGCGTAEAVGHKLVRGTNGPDRLVGAEGEANQLFGRGGNDTLIGADRADLIVDGGGDDVVLGEDGADLVIVGTGFDEVDGGGGGDTLGFAAGSDGVTVDLLSGFGGGAAFGDTFRSIENVVGTGGNDELFGNDGRNTMIGRGGDDRIAGSGGADLMFGGDGVDTLEYFDSPAGVSVDLATGAASGGDAEGDVFQAGRAVGRFESLVGSTLADRLTGDGGANELTGATGRDLLTGGAGADGFIYRGLSDSTAAAGGRDRIRDFGAGEVLDLSALDPDRDTFANEAFAFLEENAFTGAGGELRFAQTGGGTVVLADVDGDRAADFGIRLDGLIALGVEDFVL